MPDDIEGPGAEVSDTMSENENECDDIELKNEREDDGDHIMAEAPIALSEVGTDTTTGEVKKKYDPKDPSRPRRKKARRACFACQRAHLTCGDERPCQRCIKRGLAEHCQDGVRKKAKYLHDAPPEALRPVLGPNYNPNASAGRPTNGARHASSTTSDASSTVGSSLFSSRSSNFPVFSTGQQTPVASLPEGMPFGTQQSPLSPTFQGPNSLGQGMGGVTVPVTQDLANHLIFDPSNPALFNFNLDGLNFRNTYGGVEMAMLNHMSAGASETPPGAGDVGGFGTNHGFGNGNGAGAPAPAGLDQFGGQGPNFDRNIIENLIGLENLYPNGSNGSGNLSHGLPFAVAVAAGPQSLHSPSTTDNNSPQPTNLGFEGSPTTGNFGNKTPVQRPANKPRASAGGPFRQSLHGKRSSRDPSAIYDSVKDPYPYVKGFHNLIVKLHQRRLGAAQLARIAKSLASIRPSFIACTRTLNRLDLVFMEKCFQRTLFEYEDFMHHCSAPTIVCRRTGEVAAVNKEFTALTGWTKEVLLGKEPNLNANTGVLPPSASSTSLNSGRAGLTPRMSALKPDLPQGDRPQPVFIAELLDEDSVVEVYEDFAELAFENSRGHVTRKCKLVKYRTKESMDSAASNASTTDEGPKDARRSLLSSRVSRIDGEHAISRLEKDGKVDCTYTWTIKRDVFDIPMMIVMNFLPCYYRNQEPHHLPV
ncbi:C6 finger domain-containing protein [Zalerion maritima]|uniref:C6 finger domain-containing protein n=1 Tax=Zalerion maritima TaxID=339359 RepID=A0AAD5RQC7_9PEZI|nr:C6 finger domain-containing protein [Zalerion maritima]